MILRNWLRSVALHRRSFWDRGRRILFRYWTEVDNWRDSDLRRYCVAVLWIQIKFERQTKPDKRWHIGIGLRSEDGTGWHHHGGWVLTEKRGKRYCTLGHADFYVSFSMRPIYKVRYAPSWIRSVARLTGRHPIEVAEKYVAEGREITPQDPAPAPAEDGDSHRKKTEQ